MKFSRKLFWVVFGTSLLAVFLVCGAFYGALRSYRTEEFQSSYVDHIKLFGVTILQTHTTDPKVIVPLLKSMIDIDSDNDQVDLLGGNNVVLAVATGNEREVDPTLSDFAKMSDGFYWMKDKLIVLSTAQEAPPLRLAAKISTASFRAEMQKLEYLILIIVIALALLSIFSSQLLTGILIRKVRDIGATVSRIGHTKDYEQRIPVNETLAEEDELENLALQFNQMFASLQINQQELLEAEHDKARSQIAAQVAHDIRSPLTTLNFALGDLANTGGSTSEAIASLKNAVARLSGIVQKLGTSQKTSAGETVETPKLTLVEPILESIANEWRLKVLPGQSLHLVDVPSVPKIWAVIQENEIQTVISNLIQNAFEAKATEVTATLSTEGKEWKLEIQDNGVGMSPHYLPKIFDRGFTQGKVTGTGLGLFQAKVATEWNGGRIDVHSELGKGTCFILTFPLEKEPAFIARFAELDSDQYLCIVDDDFSVLDAWKKQTRGIPPQQIKLFSSLSDLDRFLKADAKAGRAVLILDQHLGAAQTGLHYLRGAPTQGACFLCTTAFNEKDIQDEVKRLKIKLIPKPMIPGFEIRTS